MNDTLCTQKPTDINSKTIPEYPEKTTLMVQTLKRMKQIAQMESLDDLVQESLGLIREITGGHTAILYLLDKTTDEMIITSVCGDNEYHHLIGIRLKRRLILVDEYINSIEPILIGDPPEGSLFFQALYPTLSVRITNVILILLRSSGKLAGVIQVIDYKQTEMEIIQILAEHLVMEMFRLVRLENILQENQRLHGLLGALNRLGTLSNRDDLLREMTASISRLVDCDRTSVFLLDDSSKNIAFSFSCQPGSDDDPSQPASPTKSEAERIIRLNFNENTHRSQSPPHNSDRSFGLVTRSAINLPLMVLNNPTEGTTSKQRTIGGLVAFKQNGVIFHDDEVQLLETLANHAGIFLQALDNQSNAVELFLDVVKAMIAAIEAKDPYTQGHSMRVFDLAVNLAQEMKLDPNTISSIKISSLLHDVGKIGIPDSILKKTGKLSREEYDVIKMHPVIGANMMRQVNSLLPAIPGILEHHERLDGSGYPLGLRGDEISLQGKILAIADVFDAMTSQRPYRSSLAASEALDFLETNSGKLFDPEYVRNFAHLVKTGKIA